MAPVWSASVHQAARYAPPSPICAGKAAFVIVLEEHSVYGGLGTAITEISGEHAPTRVLRIGVEDCFSEYCGTYDYLMDEHQLTVDHVVPQSDRLSGPLWRRQFSEGFDSHAAAADATACESVIGWKQARLQTTLIAAGLTKRGVYLMSAI